MKIKIAVTVVIGIAISLSQTVYSESNIEQKKANALDAFIEEALSNNPQVQAARCEWEAACYKISQEYALPDPIAQYTCFGENIETRVGPQEHKYGGSLKIPFPSKLILKGKAQARRADILREKYEAVKRELIKDIKFVYYDIYWIDRAIEITEQEEDVVEGVEKVAQRKYETNQAKQQDVIKTQIELSNFVDRLLRLKQHRKTLVAKINDILSRSQGRDLDIQDSIVLPVFDLKLNDLRETALKTKQELAAAEIDVERADYEKSLAMQDFIPDVTVGFDYLQVGEGRTNSPNDGQDAWMTTFSINVPLWIDKQWACIKEKSLLLDARQKDHKSIKNKVLYEVQDLYYKVLSYQDIVTLYKTALLPQSKQALKVVKAGYETGNVNFIDWLDSERVLLQTQLAYYKAVVDYMKSIAFLERIVGIDLYPELNYQRSKYETAKK
ncbi:MAG: TolC family protein [Candidatus Omnitrophota bacterium]